jgi:hypothetical protein
LGLIFAIICENHEIGQLQLMFLPRKDHETYLFFNRYEESNIQDFAAHCAMKNEQMAQGRNFESKSESQGTFYGKANFPL